MKKLQKKLTENPQINSVSPHPDDSESEEETVDPLLKKSQNMKNVLEKLQSEMKMQMTYFKNFQNLSRKYRTKNTSMSIERSSSLNKRSVDKEQVSKTIKLQLAKVVGATTVPGEKSATKSPGKSASPKPKAQGSIRDIITNAFKLQLMGNN